MPINDPAYFNTQLQILSGPGLLRRVAKTLDLEHNEAFLRPQMGPRSTWQAVLHMVGRDAQENDKTKKDKPDDVLLLPWNLRDELTKQLGYVKNWGGRFVTFVPELTVW